MKRRVEDTPAKVEAGTPQALLNQRVTHPGASLATGYTAQTIKSTTSSEVSQFPTIHTSYVTMPSITTSLKTPTTASLGGSAPHGGILVQPSHLRHNKVTPGGGTTPPTGGVVTSSGAQQFQRLKVEDALSYLDQVKYKFSNQPQVYNDFLDIMKEFKSQCIDTPGVIARVSKLFDGYPELISGFNTFLPPGYKIEVQANDTGYSLQVSVSMTSPVGHHSISDLPPPLIQTQTATPVVVPTQPQKPPPTVYSISNSTTSSNSALVSASGVNTTQTVSTCVGSNTSIVHVKTERSNTAVSTNVSGIPGSTNIPTAPSTPAPGSHQATNQPVEFNHAINYVNKIKNRFQGQPDKYKKFLEILHTYQKEQRTGNGSGNTGGIKHLTEAEVYSQVAKLFENQEDLLAEFGQFLPDATSHNSSALANLSSKCTERKNANSLGMKYGVGSGGSSTKGSSPPGAVNSKERSSFGSGGTSGSSNLTGLNPPVKRPISDLYTPAPHSPVAPSVVPAPVKRQKLQPLTPSLTPFNSFESLRKKQMIHWGVASNGEFTLLGIKRAIRHQPTFDTVLRYIYLYNQEIISKTDLTNLVAPVLSRFPEHFQWFKDFLGTADIPQPPPSVSPPIPQENNRGIPQVPQDRPEAATANSIDLSTCKRIGASYCAPRNPVPPRCSGRTPLCKQVLNDTWVSYPIYSEEATFVTCRKTQYEEYIYRCEDERFELDLVLECNAATIRVLDGVQKKMSRMSSEDLAKFRLDDTLGGTSPTIHIRALRRIYGDKVVDIVDGLKKSPSVAVPIVLRRLKSKEMEWRQAQKGFNKIWREQNEKYYLKSLDHQGINFKQNDLKALRSKSLYNDIESVAFDERAENGEIKPGPHLMLKYKDRSVLDDAANLLIHHVKRQTTIHKQDKQRIKQLLRHFLPDLFHHPRQDLSDDEKDSDDKMDVDLTPTKETNGPLSNVLVKEEELSAEPSVSCKVEGVPSHAVSTYVDEVYTLFYGNNFWYLFLRLHQVLCDRLAKMSESSVKIAEEEAAYSVNRKESTAVALRLKPDEHCQDCYGTMLEMVKSVLDCSMDPGTFEDTLRNMFGIHAYIGFTLDKIVTYAVRQLQQLVSEDAFIECWDLYMKYKTKGGAGGPCATAASREEAEAAYNRAATTAAAGEVVYKIIIYKKEFKMTIEHIDTETDEEEEEEEEEENHCVKSTSKWTSYDRLRENCDKFLAGLTPEQLKKLGKSVYLPRNLRKWKEPKRAIDRRQVKISEPCEESVCRILNSDTMVYVVNRDSFLYRHSSLIRAKKSHKTLTRKMNLKFREWSETWSRNNLSESERMEADDWFMGRLPDTHPNKTMLFSNHVPSKPPYLPYNRYTVKLIPPPSPSPTPGSS